MKLYTAYDWHGPKPLVEVNMEGCKQSYEWDILESWVEGLGTQIGM